MYLFSTRTPQIRKILAMAGVLLAPTLLNASVAAEDISLPAETISEGKELAFDRRKGNCLACHAIGEGTLAGNIAPPLIAMKARFPDTTVLSEKISDPTKSNPNSFMPPFGRHGILTDSEINKITAYLLTL